VIPLAVSGRPAPVPAALAVSQVVNGPLGPRFSRLLVTWVGTAPDDRPQSVYGLQIGGVNVAAR
jgi:hypothetical protein